MEQRTGKKITQALEVLYNETQDLLYLNCEVPELKVDYINDKCWPLEFYRRFISKNFPVLIKGAANSLPAVTKWSPSYLKELLGEKHPITVTLTPNGYADAIADYMNKKYFFLPEEKNMKFSQFLDLLENPQPNVVPYLQQQDSNLTSHFPELLRDVAVDIKWASEAFGYGPDAVNFWMGDKRAVSSMHKDPYENIYCVINGYKDFILIPPLDLPYVPYREYPVRKYKNVTPHGFEIEESPDVKTITWIDVDPLDKSNHAIEKYEHFYRKTRQFHVRVETGDMLYLPSFWFHHVRQSHKCIAVNYWYDVDHCDPKYCYYKMLSSLC